MRKPALQVIAGPSARAHIENNGLSQADIRVMAGASGGPKWLCLAALDEYLFGDFFAGRDTPLDLLGSSSGAWRFACFAQRNPVAASRRFRDAYHYVRFPDGAGPDEVTRTSRSLLDAVFPTPEHEQQVIANDTIRLNFIVNRARGPARGRTRLAQGLGMGLAATANLVSRRALGAFFSRVLFHNPHGLPPFHGLRDLPTEQVPLRTDNLRDALMASGSIPLVLHPVERIAGAGQGPFYDGGITDYHFDIPFTDTGLVLYPHFYPRITPGWFDKALRWRRPRPEHYDNVVLLCPTQDWVARLPGGRIPDRRDFPGLPDRERESNWAEAIGRSEQLVEDFQRFLAGDLSALR